MTAPEMTTAAAGAAPLQSRKDTTVWVAAAALGLPVVLLLLWKLLPMSEYLREAVAWIDSTGPLAALAFVIVYVLAAVLGIPRTLMNVAAGVLFSLPAALLSVLAGAAAAYSLTFVIARTVARDWVSRRVAQAPAVKCLLDMVEEEGFKIVFLVRLNPFIPGVLKGYGFGTTNVRFTTYLLASVLGFLPIGLAHVYLGWAGGEAMLGESGGFSDLERWLIIGGVVVSIVLMATMYFYGRRALNRRYPAQDWS